MPRFTKYLFITTCFTGASVFALDTGSILTCLNNDADSSADHADVIHILNSLSDTERNETLVSLSPVNFGNVEWINARNNSYVADILSQHVWQLCCAPRNCCSCDPCCPTCNASFWVAGFGNFMDNTKKFDNLNRFDANAGGGLLGVDWCFGPDLFFGGSAGCTYTSFRWKDKGHGNVRSYYVALYGSWNYCDWFTIDASLIGGGSKNKFRRKIEFASIDRTAKSHPWAGLLTAHLGFRTDWNWCCTEFEPFALVDYHYFHRNHFREHGAESLDLHVKTKTQHLMRTEVGLNAYWTWMCRCSCFSPYLGLSWVGEFPLNKSKQKARFDDSSCMVNVTSYDDMVNLASPQTGLKWTRTDGFSFILGYKGLFNNKTVINQVEARFEWIF